MDEDGQTDRKFEALLHYLRDQRGFDFTGYKRTSLMRRVRHRMDQAGHKTFDGYLDALQTSPDEFVSLFNTILINVTSFFRDSDAWEYIRADAIPAMLAARGPADPIRLWSAGCASGQEPYSLAMLLADALGLDAYRQRVKIYATDIDDDALGQARSAVYDAKQVESVPEDLRDRYFDRTNGSFAVNKDVRRAVIFGRNDLVKDAPISRVDLLACRNTLMYMNGETQRNVLNRLHFALAPRGLLFLGHAEMLLSHGDRFTPVDMGNRIFRKALGTHTGATQFDLSTPTVRHGDLSALDPIRELAFRVSPVPEIVVTGEDTVAMINHQAESMFGLSTRDIGRLLRDLEVSYRPLELRTYIEQAKVDRRSARVQDVKLARPGRDTAWFEVHINPLVDPENGLVGVSIVFFDVTGNRALLDKVLQTNHQLEAAYEELQSTNEELETTNEELQSTVEELETTNEELQSTNEELETMNEELQSTNDELHAINDTLRDRSVELEQAKAFLNSVANSISSGLVVVDREMRITVWNEACEELWGLRAAETMGAVLTSLDMGLPLDEIKPMIGHALVDADSIGETVVDAVTRRGRHACVRVTCTPFRSSEAIGGALLLMELQR